MNTNTDVDGETFELRYCCVACLDVLGQGTKLRRLMHLPESPDDRDSFVQGLRSTLGTVVAIRKRIKSFFEAGAEAHGSRADDARYKSLPSNLRSDVLESLKPRIKYKYFSDTIVIYAPLADEDGSALVSGIYQMLAACAFEMLTCLASKSPIRGGIEVGPLAQWGEAEIYGPALYFAHTLESRIAEYPRIVVGQGLLGVLEDVAARKEDDNHLRAMGRRLAKLALGLVTTDDKGVAFVDFLGAGIDVMRSPAKLTPLVEKAFSFVEGEMARFAEGGNTKLRDRYRRLSEYMNLRREHWLNGS